MTTDIKKMYEEEFTKSMNKKTGKKRGFSQQDIRDAVASLFKVVKQDKLLFSAVVTMLKKEERFKDAKYTEFRTACLYKGQFVMEKVEERSWIKKAAKVKTA